MKVILLDNIENLGKIGSEIVVKSGYARNFLFPKSKAILATKENVKIFKERQFILSSKETDRRVKAKDYAKVINNLKSITIKVRSSLEGKLFGSVGSKDIAKILTEAVGFVVSKSQIRLPSGDPLKFVGVYKVKVHIYSEIFSSLDIIIVNNSSSIDKVIKK